MKLTTKNLLIVLGALGLLLAVTQLTKRGGRSKALKTELVAIDTTKVSKVEVLSGTEKLALSKVEKGWQVSLPDGTLKKAKDNAVTSMLNSLNSIQPGRLAAKSQVKWKDYQVDSAGTRVKVYEGENLNTDIVIGRFGVEGQQNFYTFVRLFEENEVYVANGFMGISIGKNATDYRESAIMKLVADSLVSISFNYPDSAFKLTKGEKWYLEDQQADSALVASYIGGLSNVSSRNFFDEEVTVNFSHTVKFTFSDLSEITMEASFFANDVILQSSENKEERFLDKTVFDKIFKPRSSFIASGK